MPRKPSKKTLRNKLDKAWSQLVKQQAGNKCEVCGKTEHLNSHHIVGRRNLRLRWELYNGVCLCPGDHTFKTNSFHQNPVWADEWLRENRGQDLKLIRSTMNEIQKWTVEDMQDKLEELEGDLS
jgi:predicted restriction endonuclease